MRMWIGIGLPVVAAGAAATHWMAGDLRTAFAFSILAGVAGVAALLVGASPGGRHPKRRHRPF